MNKLYVITGSNGEYSDRTDWNICAFRSEETAKEFVDKLEKLQRYNNEHNKRYREEFEAPFNAMLQMRFKDFPLTQTPDRPAPPPTLRALQMVCGRTGGGSVDEKKLFKEVQKEHQDNLNKWNEFCKSLDSTIRAEKEAIRKEREDASKVWNDTNYNPPENLKAAIPYCNYDPENHYLSMNRYDYCVVNILD